MYPGLRFAIESQANLGVKVREMVYGGTVSTTMIYDDRPILDHFRYVNDGLLAGVMEGKALGHEEPFFFYLKR